METGDDLKVSIEKVMHDAIRDVVQKIWDQHSILVDDVDITWRDDSRLDKRGFVVEKVRTRTTTHND